MILEIMVNIPTDKAPIIKSFREYNYLSDIDNVNDSLAVRKKFKEYGIFWFTLAQSNYKILLDMDQMEDAIKYLNKEYLTDDECIDQDIQKYLRKKKLEKLLLQ